MNTGMQKIVKTGVFLILILSFFTIVLSLKTLKEYRYVGADIPPVTTITFSGEGEVVAIPDTATFTFSVTEEAKNVSEAQQKVTEKINVALKRLADFGIEEKNIKTVSYNLYPKYEYEKVICTQFSCPPARQNLVGYEVSQTIEVKVENIDDAGKVLGAMGEAGVTQISGLTFSIKDEKVKIREARQKAILDAKTKAVELSKDLNVQLVRIVNFYESGNYPPIYYAKFGLGGAEMADGGGGPQLPAGENKIISNVNITYEIR